MFKYTDTYTDFFGVDRTEDFFFNLTRSELLNMDIAQQGKFIDNLQTIMNSGNGEKIVSTFKKLLEASYGEISEDGRRFVKVRDGHRVFEDFEQTPAFDKIYMKLATDADFAGDFVVGIMDKDIQAEAAKAAQKKLAEDRITSEVDRKVAEKMAELQQKKSEQSANVVPASFTK